MKTEFTREGMEKCMDIINGISRIEKSLMVEEALLEMNANDFETLHKLIMLLDKNVAKAERESMEFMESCM